MSRADGRTAGLGRARGSSAGDSTGAGSAVPEPGAAGKPPGPLRWERGPSPMRRPWSATRVGGLRRGSGTGPAGPHRPDVRGSAVRGVEGLLVLFPVGFPAEVAGTEDTAPLALGVLEVGDPVEDRAQSRIELPVARRVGETEGPHRAFELDGSVEHGRVGEAGGNRGEARGPARDVRVRDSVPAGLVAAGHGAARPSAAERLLRPAVQAEAGAVRVGCVGEQLRGDEDDRGRPSVR